MNATLNATSTNDDRRGASPSIFTGKDNRDNRLRRKADTKLATAFVTGVLTGGLVVTLAIMVATLFLK